MRIQVLGNVAAFSDSGEELPVGGPKQRTVLAMLCRNPGVTVSADALATAVWGDELPDRFARSLSTFVSNLRRSLGDVVVSRPAGYAFEARPGTIDADAAEAAIAKGEYESALAMWNGSPYSDVDGFGAFRTEVGRLDELRLRAERMMVRELVDAGEHAAALHHLVAFLEEHPLDEELVAMKMEALYGAGRQAEALSTFSAYRDLLAEDLGLDPSPGLVALELRILQHDGTLSPAPVSGSGSAVPAGLPLRYSSFLGRDTEVADIVAATSTSRLVTVTGPGGIGKSSVAIEAAHKLDSLPVAYLKLEPVAPGHVANAFAESNGLQPAAPADPTTVLVDYLASYPRLLVLDGCETHLDDVGEIVDMVLSNSQSRVLATSRRHLGLPGETVIRLGDLDSDAAADLFYERSTSVKRGKASSGLVSVICDAVDRMPLAIELAAARTSSIPLKRIRDRLTDQVRLLASGPAGDRRHNSIAATIEWSYDLLTESDRAALKLVSQFSASFSISEATTLSGDEYIDDSISALVVGSLVQPPDEAGRYRILEPIRQYVHSRIDEDEADTMRLRYVQWLAAEGERQYRSFRFNGDERHYFTWLRRMAGDIAEALSWSHRNDRSDISVALIAACGRFWPQVLDPSLLAENALVAVNDESIDHDSTYQIALAQTCWLTRHLDPSVAAELLERVEEELIAADDPLARQALLEGAMGVIHQLNTGAMSKEASDRLDRDHTEYREITRLIGEPLVYAAYNQALIALERGYRDEASDILDNALEQLDETKRCVAPELHLKGEIFKEDGDVDAALEIVTEAAAVADAWDRPYHQTMCQRNLAILSLYVNDPDRATNHLERHDEAMNRVGLPPADVFNPEVVAQFRAQTGDWHDFPTLVHRYLDSAPERGTTAWHAWLVGQGEPASGIAEMIYPVASWAVAHGHMDKAQALVESTSWAFEDGTPWAKLGYVARVDGLRAQLRSDTPAIPSPQSLEELHDFIADLLPAST